MEYSEIVKMVENRRLELASSDEVIEIVDYGAGNPNIKRSSEEMNNGVISKVSLRNLANTGIKNERLYNMYKILFDLQPDIILELGTCCGFSSTYMSMFCPKSKIFTIEGSFNIAKIAKENHEYFCLKNIEVIVGRFDIVLLDLLKKINPIDFAFIDGHHDKDATLAYYKQIFPFMCKNGVMLFDDITWSDGMREAWEEIKSEKRHQRIEDFEKIGAVWL